MNICVHTSPGRRGEAEPHVFYLGGHRMIVAGILGRWVEHPNRFYQVSCDDGRCFLLRYDAMRQIWQLAGCYRATAVSARYW